LSASASPDSSRAQIPSGVVGSGTGTAGAGNCTGRFLIVTRPVAARIWQTMTSGAVEPTELSRVSSVP